MKTRIKLLIVLDLIILALLAAFSIWGKTLVRMMP